MLIQMEGFPRCGLLMTRLNLLCEVDIVIGDKVIHVVILRVMFGENNNQFFDTPIFIGSQPVLKQSK